ncbi:hypothetical protein BH683_000040 [Williamsia sp. 1138]|uniref:hypothetical protein n=1 Tax=Williamsia sp. 1138 TaxID=1903117 RepID=UPI000A0FE21A|nr:hypothetical protein [Williamsia sp. 1138]OZG31216.1 hypothetical protein BH683_000040 [Williamsia sp. 1138]
MIVNLKWWVVPMGNAGEQAEHDRTPAKHAETGSGKPLMASTVDGNWKLYRVAFDESVRTLEQQFQELSSLRQRLVQYLAFVVTATAFLVGSSLSRSAELVTRDALFYVIAGTGTTLVAVTIVLTGITLLPSATRMATRASAKVIISNHIERDVPPVSEGQLLRTLAKYNDKARVSNNAKLKLVRNLYVGAIVCGALQLTVWIVLVWLRT